MNIRPRCREWFPLTTQQLRLRNLQSIQGINIEQNLVDACSCSSFSSCPCTETFLYYTLHDHPENEAFYESEKLPLRMYLPLRWAEIQCLSIIKSNANCVCIKIWVWLKKTEQQNQDEQGQSRETQDIIKEPISALTREFAKSKRPSKPPDKLLFCWAVYFSGLIPLSQNSEAKCCKNTLIFQMNDELFASPDNFTTENLREQLALNYERYSASVPKCSIPTPDEFTINSPHVSRSSSPVAVDWQKDLLRMSRTRYAQLNCVRSEVRTSYDLGKLLRLQKLQRLRLQTKRESVELTADIKRISLRCITKEQLLQKPRTTSISSTSASSATASQYHSMGRTLSLLLAEQQRIDPHQLLRGQQLQLQLESLKSRQRLLQSARDTFSRSITLLRQQLTAATTSRQQLQTWLSGRRHKISDDKADLEDLYILRLERKQRKRAITQHVERRTSSLCIELKKIYPIYQSFPSLYTICGVSFPLIVSSIYDFDQIPVISDTSPMDLGVSLGYVAHLVEMISVIINCPLRNPIIHEGSRTRIKDVIKDIPSHTVREYPLYCRSSFPTKAVKYAINLLNQNIVQLCFDIADTRRDMRTTIENILYIFEMFTEIEQNKREMHSHTQNLRRKHFTINELSNTNEIEGNPINNHEHFIKNGKDYSLLSKSHSSVDMDHMPPPPPPPLNMLHHRNIRDFPLTSENLKLSTHLNSQPIHIQQERSVLLNNQQRICRSVGSYTDSEDERDCHTSSVKGFSNSVSNLTLHSGHI